MTVFEAHRLSFWEECTGVLERLRVEGDLLICQVGRIALVLPLEMEQKVLPHIGKRVAILRTDLPDKSHLLRVYPDHEKINNKKGT